MEEIAVMSYGHIHWNETAEFSKNCSWRAGAFLAQKMKANDFERNERVIAAYIDGSIAGFCTYTNKDELPEEYDFTPFIGFLFVDELYRGQRLSERMIAAACDCAKAQGHETIYVMSGEIGLYEKYGFKKIGDYETIYHSIDQLFSKKLSLLGNRFPPF